MFGFTLMMEIWDGMGDGGKMEANGLDRVHK